MSYPEDSVLAACIFSLSISMRRSAETIFRKELGVGASEWGILAMIASSGAANPTQLCERLQRDKAHLSRDIAGLVERGILTRRREAADGRYISVDFAPDAEAVKLRIVQIVRAREDQLTRGLSEDEVRDLKRMVLKLLANSREMDTTSA